MKIAFDYQIFSQQSYGGISRYYQRLATEFLLAGEEIKVFSGLHKNNYLLSLPKTALSGFRLRKFPPKSTKFIMRSNQYITRNQINKWQPDILHETYYQTYSPFQKKLPIVVTVYDMIHELYPNEFPKNDLISKRKRDACLRSSQIISISHNTKKDLIKFFDIPPEKITVVHLACDFNLKHGIDISKKSIYSKPFLLFVGGRGGYKNFNSLLEAVSISNRLIKEFDIVAFGGGVFSSKENTFIRSLGFKKDQVKQVGGDDSVLASLYQSASAFVYPSLYEGFGIPPLEAMANECPVIASNSSSIPEVVGEAGEYFNPENVESLSLAIENVVFNQNRIIALKSEGLKRINAFSWKKCAQETLNVYNKIIN